ncbi:DoxX family protein [Streptomyces sp. NPDC051567]|uniref:DoxX family protein n=1 Tax=Streptomyces sp. NPDC051567 TaxID=3365660 RepID=UPI0037ADFACA
MTSHSVPPTKPQAAEPAVPYGASPLSPFSAVHDTGLLLLRLALGLTMAAHGSQKLFGWFGGGGISGTGAFFTKSGYPAGDTMALLAGLTETLGGLGLAVGLLTPLAAAALVGTLVNAVAVHGTGAFFAPKGSEYELLLTVVAAALALTGPGRYALDRFLPGLRTPRPAVGALAVLLGLVLGGALLLVRN